MACLNIILQPFVENSIMHGIAEIPSMKECHIKIYAQRALSEADASEQSSTQDCSQDRAQEDLLLYIEDNGPGMTEDQIQKALSIENLGRDKGYGIKNVNFRIKLSFGEKYGVTFQSRQGQGTTAIIKIPMLSPEEARQQ